MFELVSFLKWGKDGGGLRGGGQSFATGIIPQVVGGRPLGGRRGLELLSFYRCGGGGRAGFWN